MESLSCAVTTTTTTRTATALTFLTFSKALNRPFGTKSHPLVTRSFLPSQLVTYRLKCIYTNCLSGPNYSVYPSAPSSSLRRFCAVVVPELRRRLECVSSSAVSFGTAARGRGDGDSKSKLGAGAGEEVSALSPDVIILHVGGMTCGGCAASVERILESKPQVSSATVNLTTETAIVWPVSEAKVVPNWQQQLGEALAKHLTSCGFKSNLRGEGAIERGISP